jgi:uncharacterized protein (TIGR03000 family)
MFGKHFLVPMFLSVAGLLAVCDLASAQRGRSPGGRPAGGAGFSRGPVGRGGYGYGGGYGGGAYYYGGYGRGFYGGWGWGYPYYGFGLGLGLGLGAYGPYYGLAYDAYAPGTSFYPPVAGAQAAPPTQGVPASQQQDSGPPNAAHIRVLVPDADTVILFDGNKTTQTGTERYYHTPPLTTGANNTYRIRAIVRVGGKDLALEQVVPVSAGQYLTVDFTRPPPAEKVAPPGGKD